MAELKGKQIGSADGIAAQMGFANFDEARGTLAFSRGVAIEAVEPDQTYTQLMNAMQRMNRGVRVANNAEALEETRLRVERQKSERMTRAQRAWLLDFVVAMRAPENLSTIAAEDEEIVEAVKSLVTTIRVGVVKGLSLLEASDLTDRSIGTATMLGVQVREIVEDTPSDNEKTVAEALDSSDDDDDEKPTSRF